MVKENNVTSLFLQMNRLKDEVKRKGWHDRNIKRFRVESVADHIFGCQMLAYAMYSEFNYDIDIEKVILMLAIHEIGETIIGDYTPYDMPNELKKAYEKAVVLEFIDSIPNGDFIKDLFLEFEEGKTKEAKFAYQVDKAECDLQAVLYEQEGCFRHAHSKDEIYKSTIIFDRGRIEFDENFAALLEYVTNNDMTILPNQANPIQNVISFYSLTNKLKDKKCASEEMFKVKKEQYGSVAEHVFSVQMLELLIYLVYGEDINIKKVISMTSTHELARIIHEDLKSLKKTDYDKEKEINAVKRISSILTKGDILLNQFKEFNSHKTKESIYSNYSDKLASDILSKYYYQLQLIEYSNEIPEEYLDGGISFQEMCMLYGREDFNYPEPFKSVSNSILNNELELPKIHIKTLFPPASN